MGWISVVERVPFDEEPVLVSTVSETSKARGRALPAVFLGGEFVEYGPAQSWQRVRIPDVIAWQPFPALLE